MLDFLLLCDMGNAKKRLLVDLSKLQGAYCGLWEVARRFGQALSENIDYDRWELTFLVPGKHPFADSRVRYLRLRWWHRFLAYWQHRYDVLHGLAQNTPYLRRKLSHRKYVITLHDLNFLYEKEGSSRKRYLRKYQRGLSGVDYLVFISHFVEGDTMAHLKLHGAKHAVVYNGVAQRPAAETSQVAAALEQRLRAKPFLFFISTFTRKKNIHLLVDMMKHLPDLTLVVAGRVVHHDYYREVRRAIEVAGLSDRIALVGTVSDAEKYWLYDHCKAFVFPSQAEGFGIPPIEAMQAGKPVFAARSTSIPEVCGSMAFYWETLEGEPMAAVVRQGLDARQAPQNNADLLRAHADKYSWKRCAQEYIKIYEELTGECNATRR